MSAEPRCLPERMSMRVLHRMLVACNEKFQWCALITLQRAPNRVDIEITIRDRRNRRWPVVFNYMPRLGLSIAYPRVHVRGTMFAGVILRLNGRTPARNYEHAVAYVCEAVAELSAVIERHPEDVMLLD